MNFNQKLMSIGNYDFRLNHLLIISILCLSFSISFLIRILPGNLSWDLNEFDPFFNYRATSFLLDNGLSEYFSWHDELSWYPHGRNVSETSQVILHITAASLYYIFNFGSQLYDFLIIFPVIIGSITTFIIFFLVRILVNTTAGLFSSLLFSISIPIILRGSLGWFKSEPLGLFFGLIGIYLLVSGFKGDNFSKVKLPFSGLFLIFGLSAWGGDQLFILTAGLFLICITFIQKNYKNTFLNILSFSFSILLFSLIFERSSINFLSNLSIVLILGPMLLSTISIYIHKKSQKNKSKKSLAILLLIILIGSIGIFFADEFSIIKNPTFRYVNAINPFLTTNDPLVDSISEHATTNLEASFFLHSILMVFSGLGIWLIFTKKFLKTEMKIFILIFTLIAVYVSSTFMRLEVFASISLIITSSIALSYILKQNTLSKINNIQKIILISGIFIMLSFSIIPLDTHNTYRMLSNPPPIYNGGSQFLTDYNDWKLSLEWIKNNTPQDSVIASWWDYGYWIQTLGERATIADNSTLIDHAIVDIAKILFDKPENAWGYLMEKEVDYFIIFITGQRFFVDNTYDEPIYYLGGGGDESKKVWFSRVASLDENKFMYSDKLSATPEFWENTFFGKMIPFEPIGYVNTQNQNQSLVYLPGYDAVYVKNVKFNNSDEPFRLAYVSPSINAEKGEPLTVVLIYEVNKNYIP